MEVQDRRLVGFGRDDYGRTVIWMPRDREEFTEEEICAIMLRAWYDVARSELGPNASDCELEQQVRKWMDEGLSETS